MPGAVRVGEAFVSVQRAWPSTRRGPDDERVVRFEGLDARGLVRAGQLHVRPEGGFWRTTRAELTPYGVDRKLPDLHRAARHGEVVVHRLGRRAVVRRPATYVKVLPARDAVRAGDQAAAGRRLAAAAGLRAPEVISVEGGAVTMGVLPGRSLHDLGGGTDPRSWDRWWRAWAQLWPDLVRGDSTGLSAYTAADEQRTLTEWVGKAVDFGVLDGLEGRLVSRAHRAGAGLGDSPPTPAGVSHRDLHDKQVLVDGERVGLLDFDTAAVAEPALDLANLTVHAQLRATQGLWSPWHRDTAVAHVRRVADTLQVPPARFAAYAESTRVRLACLYAFRPRWHRLAVSLLVDRPPWDVRRSRSA